jgi:hypothetical protein
MSSNARYVRGDVCAKPVLCDANYPIEIGDLLFREPTNALARPANAMIEQGSETLTQQEFHNLFLGVALQKNGLQPGETVPLHGPLTHQPANCIMVATQGIFRFPIQGSDTSVFQGGESIGPATVTDSAGTQLQNQVVEKVANIQNSIGRASPSAASINATAQAFEGQPPTLTNSVEVEILSTIFYGGEAAPVVGSSSGPA